MSTVVHVGLSKAASTSLQKHLFPFIEEIDFLGKDLSSRPGLYANQNVAKVMKDFVNLDRYDGSGRTNGEALLSETKKSADAGKVPVLSNEHLCESVCPYFQACLMKEYLEDVKILLIVRNQYDAILSHYSYVGSTLQFTPDSYRDRFVSFDAYFRHCEHTYRNMGGHKGRDWISDYFRILDFNSFLKINEMVFGAPNIAVVPFERLVRDKSIVFQRISDLTGVQVGAALKGELSRENSSMSARGLWLLRASMMVPYSAQLRDTVRTRFPDLHRRLTRSGAKMGFEERYRDRISTLFAPGNREVSERYGLDLKALGYPM